jgi:hypothetical protein
MNISFDYLLLVDIDVCRIPHCMRSMWTHLLHDWETERGRSRKKSICMVQTKIICNPLCCVFFISTVTSKLMKYRLKSAVVLIAGLVHAFLLVCV